MNDQIIIYQTPDGHTAIDVKLTEDTIWLNQYQLADLFDTDRTSIVKHIKNIYSSAELSEEATCAKFAQVQDEGSRKIKREVIHYNLDLCISVGYRVNSKRGTQFRLWANKVLKEYLIKGYAINEQRLREQNEQFNSLKQTVNLLGSVLKNKQLTSDEATGLLKVVTDYSYALDILDRYDHQQLTLDGTSDQQLFTATYEEAMLAIKDLKDK